MTDRECRCLNSECCQNKNTNWLDGRSSIGLSDRFQKLCLEFGWDLERFVRIAREHGSDATFGQRIPVHDNLSTYDGSGS